MTAIAPPMTASLRQRLPVERAASQPTGDTYASAFQILRDFASPKLAVPPSALPLAHLDAPRVREFLEHLPSTRGHAPRPRNARLTALKSCMPFVEHRVPGALEQISRVLAMPNRKTDRPLVDPLTAEPCKALLDHPEPTTRLGIRDRALLHVSVTAGWRVAELVGRRLDEVAFESRYLHLPVRGKGRKNRLLTLWKAVAASVRAWLAVRGAAIVPALLLNARGKEMPRAGFEYL
jgi:integrase/recombinase XerD